MEEIYVILNDSMPELMKVGSGDTNQRLEEANRTARTWMPTPYYIYLRKGGFDKDHHQVTERGIHRILDDIRIKTEKGSGLGTEWFKKDLVRVKLLFDGAAGHYIKTSKEDIELFKQKVLAANISSIEEYQNSGISPTVKEIEIGYFSEFDSLNAIMGWSILSTRR